MVIRGRVKSLQVADIALDPCVRLLGVSIGPRVNHIERVPPGDKPVSAQQHMHRPGMSVARSISAEFDLSLSVASLIGFHTLVVMVGWTNKSSRVAWFPTACQLKAGVSHGALKVRLYARCVLRVSWSG